MGTHISGQGETASVAFLHAFPWPCWWVGNQVCLGEMAAYFLSWEPTLRTQEGVLYTWSVWRKVESSSSPHFFPLLHPLLHEINSLDVGGLENLELDWKLLFYSFFLFFREKLENKSPLNHDPSLESERVEAVGENSSLPLPCSWPEPWLSKEVWGQQQS